MPDQTRYLTADDVLAIADEFFLALGYAQPLARAGGCELLESAVHRARTVAHYGAGDLFDQAAALTLGILMNHPLVDGNKRLAFAACVVFLRQNGHPVPATLHLDLADQLIALPSAPETAVFARWLRAIA